MAREQSTARGFDSEFAQLALPTAFFSLVVAALLLWWPEWSMRFTVDQFVKGHLFLFVGTLAVIINGAMHWRSLRGRSWALIDIVGLAAIVILAVFVVWLFQLLAQQESLLPSSSFWQEQTPTNFRRLAAELVAYFYFAFVGATFFPAFSLSILDEMAWNLFSVTEPPTPNPPTPAR
jgi:hypothetical protein